MEAYFEHLQYYGTNNKGSCGYIALSQILTYFDTYWNDNIVPERYDYISDGDGKNMLLRFSSPGSYPDNLDGKTAEEYYESVKECERYSLHAKLIYIGGERLHIFNKHPTIIDGKEQYCGTNFFDLVDLLKVYLMTETIINTNDYGITYETGSSNTVREYVIEEIKKGYPVLVVVKNTANNGTHACVAYAYDENYDKIFFHQGYAMTKTRQTLTEMGFDAYVSAMTFFPHVDHVHSDNYAVKTSYGTYDYYCACSDEIVTYKHDACSFTDSYDNTTSTQHTGHCICGKKETVDHSYTDNYIVNRKDTSVHTGYCVCAKSKSQSNVWKIYNSDPLQTGSYVQCQFCNFIKKVGPNDRIPVIGGMNKLSEMLEAISIIL